jgi:MFS family permease
MALTLFFYLLALVSWLGGMFFFLLTTVTIFGTLPLPEAGRVLAALFPRYYMLGYIAGAIASLLAIYITAAHPPRLWWGFASAALVIALVLTLYAGVIIRPRVDAIRTVNEEPNPDPARKAEFDRLHQLSVRLNGAVIVLNLVALATTATALTRHA